MSWDVYLLDSETGKPVEVARHSEGGTYAVGGTDEADLNITYNYSPRFREAWDGLGFRDALHGKRAGDVIPLLEAGVVKLGTERAGDYWKPTPGNAGYALSCLLAWARQYPDALFEVH